MNFLSLKFSGETKLELVATEFSCFLAGGFLKSIRGKDSPGDTGSFQWTQSVQALVILLLRARLSKDSEKFENQLSGLRGTPASSLDYTLSKPPLWMLEMFGCAESGEPIVRRLFRRVNPEQKLPGPVSIAVNENFLNLDKIRIFVDKTEYASCQDISKLLSSIETDWRPARVSASADNEQSKIGSFDSLTPQLKFSFEKEISFILQNTEVFTRIGIHSVSKRMMDDISFAGLESRYIKEVLIGIQSRELNSRDRLGIVEPDEDLLSGLRVACSIGSPSALTIFNHLKLQHKVSIDFSFQHALELMHAVIRGQLSYTPDLLVLGTAPTAIFSPISQSFGYRPLMILPGMTHRVLKTGRKSKRVQTKETAKTATNFLMLNTDPSTSVMYFERLKSQKKFESRLSKVTHAEPDEIFSQLASGEQDVRSVLYFPYYEMNRVFNNSQLVDADSDISSVKDSVLFVHESLYSDPKKLSLIERTIRNSWLKMREEPLEIRKSVDSLFEQQRFTTYLRRSSGLFQRSQS